MEIILRALLGVACFVFASLTFAEAIKIASDRRAFGEPFSDAMLSVTVACLGVLAVGLGLAAWGLVR